MPFYEYECSACKYYLEVLQKISDSPMKKCPSCGKSALKRLVSAPVFRLKGSGWYETDFKSENEAKRNLVGEDKEAAPPPEKTEPAAESKTETKEAPAKAEPAKPAPKKPAAKAKPATPKKKTVAKPAKSKSRSRR